MAWHGNGGGWLPVSAPGAQGGVTKFWARGPHHVSTHQLERKRHEPHRLGSTARGRRRSRRRYCAHHPLDSPTQQRVRLGRLPGLASALASRSGCRLRRRSASPQDAGRAADRHGYSEVVLVLRIEQMSGQLRAITLMALSIWSRCVMLPPSRSGSGFPTTCRGHLGSCRAGRARLRRNSVSPCDHPPGPGAAPGSRRSS